ncbi:MAG: hypothetical protein ACRDRZ_10395 [Pseudonocardiaceae bacterium]
MMTTRCELSTRTEIRAFYAYEHLLIVAEGVLPTPGFDPDIEQSPLLIFPPQFSLLRCQRPGVFPQVETPFRHAESFRLGERPEAVTVHHAEGSDSVRVEDCGESLAPYAQSVRGGLEGGCPEGADQATGMSKNLSFDEAFRDALAQLPPIEDPHPDQLQRVQVVEIGALFGGIAGFHALTVKVCRTHD